MSTKANISSKAVNEKEYCIEVWGESALFNTHRDGSNFESYDFITPSAVEGIFAGIFRKHYAMWWEVTKIQILTPKDSDDSDFNGNIAEKETIMYNGLNSSQYTHRVLRNVRYRLWAKLHYIPVSERKAGWDAQHKPDPSEFYADKYFEMFERRAKKGISAKTLCFGKSNYPCYYKLIEDCQEATGEDRRHINITNGRMYWGKDYDTNRHLYYHFDMRDGIVVVPSKETLLATL